MEDVRLRHKYSLERDVNYGVFAWKGGRDKMEDEYLAVPFRQEGLSKENFGKKRRFGGCLDVTEMLKARKCAEGEEDISQLPVAEAVPVPRLCDDDGPRYAFFAVYDGHGGSSCAEYARMNLHNNIATCSAFQEGNIEKAIEEGFLKTEREFAEEGGDPGCGTTACVIVIHEGILYTGNVGDSKAVMCRKDKSIPLSVPHTLRVPSERDRVGKAGAVTIGDRLAHPVWNPKLINIGVTRALGDQYFKDETFTLGKPSGLIATPEVTKLPLTSADKFVILATDGFWDQLSPQEAVDYVRGGEESSPHAICKKLTDLVKKKSVLSWEDNATVILVKLTGDQTNAHPASIKASTSNLGKSVSESDTVPSSNTKQPG